MQQKLIGFFGILLLLCNSCMKWDYGDDITDFDVVAKGLFVVCEGNFQYGNATLSFYDPANNQIENEIFFRANGMKLGDVAQSMTIYDNKGWIVVNNSHVVFAIDPDTYREVGRIENLTSPRYIHFISDEKAYVTQIWDNRITIINPKTYSITGYIEVPDMDFGLGSTEQMVQSGRYVYCNCWSYQNRIIKIDTETDTVSDSLTVGIQPNSIALDAFNRLWVITDGGIEGSPLGFEAGALYCIDLSSFSIVKSFSFKTGDQPSELQISKDGETLFWLNGDVWKMNVNASALPAYPIIEDKQTKYYGLTVSPETGDIYVADAIDYSQQGIVYRFSKEGELLDSFYVGITPGAFCWKN